MTSEPPSPETKRHLSRLAEKLRTDPAFMASAVRLYQEQERLSDQQLAEHLQMPVANLPRLVLCRRPVSDRPDFSEQIPQIAVYVQAEPAALAGLIRQVEALERLASRPKPAAGETSGEGHAAPPYAPGALSAAHGRPGEGPGAHDAGEKPGEEDADDEA